VSDFFERKMKIRARQYGLSFEVLKGRRKGFSLAEVLTTVVIVVVLTLVSLPAINGFMDSMSSSGSVEVMINAALSNARAMAISKQRYVGVRFQKECVITSSIPTPDLTDPSSYELSANQYMIFIMSEEPKKMGNLTKGGYRAMDGMKPIKLPDNIGVMDFFVRINIANNASAAGDTASQPISAGDLGDTLHLMDVTSFSIIFSPSGQLVVKEIRTRNRDGYYRPSPLDPVKNTLDDIFNSPEYIATGIGKFVQDDYAHLGLGAEYSRNHFVIYDKKEFERLDAAGRFAYINSLKPIYVSSYTGKLISTE
jgi:prepilin-type N-terminal cleavage/methylation domain-containing protein